MLWIIEDKKWSIKKHLFAFPVFNIMLEEVFIYIPCIPLEAYKLFKYLFH